MINGVIDFEDSCIGDPLIDFLPTVNTLGAGLLAVLSAGRDLGSHAPLRFWFYRWMTGIHDLIYAVTEGVDEVRTSAVSEVARRLQEPRLSEHLFSP